MELKIKRNNKSVNLHIHTITLTPNYEDTIELFRCIKCGSAISQYQGDVIRIYPIVEPTEDMLVINKCDDCGNLYSFTTQKVAKPQPTKVVLFVDTLEPYNSFRCYICRIPLISYTLNGTLDLTNNAVASLPFELKCPSLDCPANFNFFDVV